MSKSAGPSGIMVICAAGALMASLVHGYAAQGDGASPAAAIARPVAERWLDLIESGEYGESWDALSNQAKEIMTREQWIAYLKGKRQPLGATRLREAYGDRYFKSLPGFPDHEGMILQYQVMFQAAMPVTESVGLILEKDGTWKPTAYLLNTDNVFKGTTEDYYKLGNTFYLQKDYEGASEMYAKALEREKRTPSLEKVHRRVLIDNLGMSYGLLRNYQAAREVLEYGIQTDDTYPNFYYNLACNYAEQDQLAEAIRYLEMAFERKGNIIPGEKMPDPAADPSFARFLSNPEFQKVLKRLTAR